jgi:hypothetical protein
MSGHSKRYDRAYAPIQVSGRNAAMGGGVQT